MSTGTWRKAGAGRGRGRGGISVCIKRGAEYLSHTIVNRAELFRATFVFPQAVYGRGVEVLKRTPGDSTVVASPNFSRTKSPVLKQPPGRISLKYGARLPPPTSSFDSPVQTRKYVNTVFFVASFLESSSHETFVKERRCFFLGGAIVESVHPQKENAALLP